MSKLLPFTFSENHCVNCGIQFSYENDGLSKFTEWPDFPLQQFRIAGQTVTVFDALAAIFGVEFEICRIGVSASVNDTRRVIGVCGECLKALQSLRHFYNEFISLSSQVSYLQLVISHSRSWVEANLQCQSKAKKISAIKNPLKLKPSAPVVSVDDIKIAPAPDLFNSSEGHQDVETQDDDWVPSPSISLPSHKECQDRDYKSKIIKNSNLILRNTTLQKTYQIKDVTVDIEPLELEKLESKVVKAEVSEDTVIQEQKVYLINKQEQRKKERRLKRKKRKTSSRSTTCQICFKKFADNSTLRRHQLVHTDERKHQCPKCPNKAYKEQKKLRYHMHSKHNEGERLPDRTCNICGRYFALPSTLQTHLINVHSKEKPFQCELCGQKFPSQNYLNIHVLTKHNDTIYKCDQCEKHLSSKHSLKVHFETVHLKQKNFTCELCQKGFYRQDWLKEHMKTHEPNREKSYHCKFCAMPFFNINCCRNHERKHVIGKDVLCSDCGAAFKNRHSLKRHIESRHTEGVSYSCDKCGKQFKVKEYYLQHMRSKTHGGPGHYAERFRTGTTKRVVKKVLPINEIKLGLQKQDDFTEGALYIMEDFPESQSVQIVELAKASEQPVTTSERTYNFLSSDTTAIL